MELTKTKIGRARRGMRTVACYLAEGRGDGLEPVAGAEVGAEGADARERVEELPPRGGG